MHGQDENRFGPGLPNRNLRLASLASGDTVFQPAGRPGLLFFIFPHLFFYAETERLHVLFMHKFARL